jgi:NAD(P)-dependent dehydrogenase (short-subunit alcohol dehydrogenase family)
MSVELQGRGALVTGASHGFGLAVAREYVTAGADVMICGRDGEALERARGEIAALARPGQIVLAQAADVSRREEVERLTALTRTGLPSFQVLVNNAGVYGPLGRIDQVDWDAWEAAIAINLLGSVLMCRAILPGFIAQRYGKIIQLSGGGASNPLPRISAYAASKAAIVRFAETLAEEVREFRIDVNAVAPGALNTRLLDQVLEAGPEAVGKAFYERSIKQKRDGGAPLERGAALATFLASAASDGLTGRLISALWDPWETLTEDRRDEVMRGDVYTLRRIVPADRGLIWGDQ